MKIYKDLFTGDELCSDTFPMKCIDDVVYEFEGKLRTDTTAVSDDMFGGNKSAEGGEEDESADGASCVSGVNFILNHNLVEFPTDKKSYMSHIKEYMKKVVDKLKEDKPGEVRSFRKTSNRLSRKSLLIIKNIPCIAESR